MEWRLPALGIVWEAEPFPDSNPPREDEKILRKGRFIKEHLVIVYSAPC